MNVEKYQIERPGEKEMFDLIFSKGKGIAETQRELAKMGIAKDMNSITNFKRKVVETIIESDRAEYLADYALESTERMKIEFNDIMAYTKELLETAKGQGAINTQLEVIKELRAQVELALKKQGQLQSSVHNTMMNIQNNIVTTSDLMEQMEKVKISWLETSKATMNSDGKIVFEEPTGEMIDLFKKWKFSKEFSRAKVFDIG